jgi:hypothetical protein
MSSAHGYVYPCFTHLSKADVDSGTKIPACDEERMVKTVLRSSAMCQEY